MCRKTIIHIRYGTYSSNDINDGNFVLWVVLVLFLSLFADQGPQSVEIDSRHVVLVLTDVEMSHTDLSEVTRMVLVEVDAVVMLATSVTATTRMLTVLANTSMTMADVSSKLSGLLLVGGHVDL